MIFRSTFITKIMLFLLFIGSFQRLYCRYTPKQNKNAESARRPHFRYHSARIFRNLVRIKDKDPQHRMIDKNGNVHDFTCLFRASVYAETHLKGIHEYLQNNKEHFDIEALKKHLENSMPDNMKEQDFLGLKFGNYVDMRIFQLLCKNAYENGCHISGLSDLRQDWSIYNNICYFSFHPLSGSIVGAGSIPDGKKQVLTALPTIDHQDYPLYFSDVYKNMKKKYTAAQSQFPDLNLDSLKYSFLFNDQTLDIINHIEALHKNEFYAFSIVTSSDCSGGSLTLHAMTFTIMKHNGSIHYFLSEGSNEAEHDEELIIIDRMINKAEYREEIKKMLQKYHQ